MLAQGTGSLRDRQTASPNKFLGQPRSSGKLHWAKGKSAAIAVQSICSNMVIVIIISSGQTRGSDNANMVLRMTYTGISRKAGDSCLRAPMIVGLRLGPLISGTLDVERWIRVIKSHNPRGPEDLRR